MELGKIKARIREKGCNPSIPMVVPGSNKILWVTVQKNSLMLALDELFPTKVSETGLMFDGDKLMPVKNMAGVSTAPAAVVAPQPLPAEAEWDLLAGDEDEDDLLGAAAPSAGGDDDDILC